MRREGKCVDDGIPRRSRNTDTWKGNDRAFHPSDGKVVLPSVTPHSPAEEPLCTTTEWSRASG